MAISHPAGERGVHLGMGGCSWGGGRNSRTRLVPLASPLSLCTPSQVINQLPRPPEPLRLAPRTPVPAVGCSLRLLSSLQPASQPTLPLSASVLCTLFLSQPPFAPHHLSPLLSSALCLGSISSALSLFPPCLSDSSPVGFLCPTLWSGPPTSHLHGFQKYDRPPLLCGLELRPGSFGPDGAGPWGRDSPHPFLPFPLPSSPFPLFLLTLSPSSPFLFPFLPSFLSPPLPLFFLPLLPYSFFFFPPFLFLFLILLLSSLFPPSSFLFPSSVRSNGAGHPLHPPRNHFCSSAVPTWAVVFWNLCT